MPPCSAPAMPRQFRMPAAPQNNRRKTILDRSGPPRRWPSSGLAPRPVKNENEKIRHDTAMAAFFVLRRAGVVTPAFDALSPAAGKQPHRRNPSPGPIARQCNRHSQAWSRRPAVAAKPGHAALRALRTSNRENGNGTQAHRKTEPEPDRHRPRLTTEKPNGKRERNSRTAPFTQRNPRLMLSPFLPPAPAIPPGFPRLRPAHRTPQRGLAVTGETRGDFG